MNKVGICSICEAEDDIESLIAKRYFVDKYITSQHEGLL